MADAQEAPAQEALEQAPAGVPDGGAQAPAGAEVTDEVIKGKLLDLLKTADLSTTTEKQLRKKLEEQLGCDLTEKKQLIRAEVEAFLQQQEEAGEDGEEEEEEEEAPKTKRRKRDGSALGSRLSPAMQEFLGVETMARPQVVKAIWAYIKEHNLQDPKNKRNIICDEKMLTIFKPPINMFNMNKQLSKHCKTGGAAAEAEEEEEGSEEADEDDEEPKPKKKPAKRAKKSGDGEGTGKVNGFQKPVQITPELAAFLGSDKPVSRPELTKRFWEYFRTNNLQDPSDKRIIQSDERLEQLLGVKKFQAFGLMKHLNKHIVKSG